MTVLAANWENMGGGVLRKAAEGGVLGSQGDTIVHPLKANVAGDAGDPGVYQVSRWTNKAAADFPSALGAKTASATGNTLAEAFAAVPA